MTSLIIVESPTKAKTLNRFLGSEYRVEATYGHMKDLPKSKLGVDVDNDFAPVFVEVPKQKANIKKLISAAKKSTKIYLATDPDREGEAISAHVAEVLKDANVIKKQTISRIVFHEITQSAVEEAIAHPREVDAHLVDAQTARRVLDRLVGYKLSPLLWKKIRIGLSAGRVQSVAVRLIVEREREIAAYKPTEYWEIGSEVSPQGKKEQFYIGLTRINGKTGEVHTETDAKKIVATLEKSPYTVKDVKRREVRKRAYPPFTTSTMTQAAARMFGWSAKRTMMVAQKLYEEGVISYHRTDSVNIAQQALTSVRSLIDLEYGASYVPKAPLYYKKQTKSAQEAHEAIRPTNLNNATEVKDKLLADNKKLYDLIWRRFVACQMNEAIYDETVIEVTCDIYTLRASGQIMKFDGWRKLFPQSTDDDVQTLPDVSKGDKLGLNKVLSVQKFTLPPPRYNEASIIKTLEKLGIGRPSTYAPTISTIQTRNYIEKTDGKFVPTSVGVAVNDFLIGHFPDVFEYGFTADMEDKLDRVADGKLAWQSEIRSFWKPLDKKVEDVEKTAERVKIATEKVGRACPECKVGELIIRTGRFGKFISCDKFPDCKYTEKLIHKIDMKCPTCKDGEVVLKKTKKGRTFYGCSRYPECDFASWKKPEGATPIVSPIASNSTHSA